MISQIPLTQLIILSDPESSCISSNKIKHLWDCGYLVVINSVCVALLFFQGGECM